MFQSYEGYENGRYKTPAGFRRTVVSELVQKRQDEQRERERGESEQQTACNYRTRDPDMSNPYMDRGYTMPYQISQNRYKEQVFGSMPKYNYPQEKPEPLAGRARPPRNYRPGSYPLENQQNNMSQERNQNNYNESPRHFDSPRQQPFGQRPQQYELRDRPNYMSQERNQNNYNESPRHFDSPRQQPFGQKAQQYEPRTYRSGRPDLGFEDYQNNSVPYPQEPARRRRPNYEHPPDIGFGLKLYPYGDQEPPKKSHLEDGQNHDISIEDGTGPHPGWVLLLRFHRNGLPQVRHALTMCNKHIESDSGRILGIAMPDGVRIKEGGDSWVTFGKMRYFGGGNWDVQQGPTQTETNYCVLALYYPSLTRAIQWFDRDSEFKQKDFPVPYTIDCIALPLNSSVDTKYNKTLVMTEYPRISHPEYFRDRFSIPSEDMMRSRFRASPYVVKASSIPVDDHRERVAKHLRGCWIKRNSIITLSMFDSMAEANRYYSDPEFYKCKEAQDRVSAPTTVIMDLEDWRF